MSSATTATAVEPVPSYPRVPRALPVQVLVWANCASLLICGVIAFYFACAHFTRLSHVVLSLYWIVFGVISIAAEMRMTFAERAFGFLCTKNGLAFFFIFAGTLGISFGIGSSAAVLVPFIAGIIGVVIGAVCVAEEALSKRFARNTTATVEAV